MSSEQLSDEEITFERKQKIAAKIENLKKICHYENIHDIIIANNPDINITKTTKGQYIYFQNLTPQTYIAIEQYIASAKKQRTTASDILTSQSDSEQKCDPFLNNPKLRYNNREMNLIKRKQYDEIVDLKSCDDQNVFAKKRQIE